MLIRLARLAALRSHAKGAHDLRAASLHFEKERDTD